MLDYLSMTRKTKAEKIAAALRAKRHELVTSQTHTSSVAPSTLPLPQPSTPPLSTNSPRSIRVYDPTDLRKTFVTTFFITALLTLIYVLQFKGYF